MEDYPDIIEKIVSEKIAGTIFPVVINLCDGDEINGSPGISVVQLLAEKELVYTGADEYFYHITTSKIPMKLAFDRADLPTAPWKDIQEGNQDLSGYFHKLGSPIIVKPAVSGGSMGVGVKNVVHNTGELDKLVQEMFAGYRGWELTADGLIAESFINGPEFTTLITGSAKFPSHCRVYDPVERVFHPSLPDEEKFLSFDRLWEIYEEESAMPGEDNFYEYRAANPAIRDAIMKISLDAYIAVGGTGYTRVDIRMDKATGKLYVLEVNAQCGLSEDEDYTSIGAILRINQTSFTALVVDIINDAFRRYRDSVKQKNSLVMREK